MNTESNGLAEAIEALIDHGRSQGGLVLGGVAGSDPVVIVPEGYKALGLEKFVPPSRIKGVVRLKTVEAFSDYVKRFKTAETLIFADISDSGATFTAIIDYHTEAGDAQRCEHRAVMSLEATAEWKKWLQNDRRQMDQVAFAEMLEDQLDLIVSPPGADLLELIQNLEGHNNARFRSAIRLQSGGRKLQFDEDIELKGSVNTKPGSVDIPAQIEAVVPLWIDCKPEGLTARLKFRIEGARLLLWYETQKLQYVVGESVEMALDGLRGITEAPVLRGTPPA